MIRSQLPLDLGHRPALSGDDFLVAPCNADAHAWLDRWPDWPAPALCLYGPKGCGKTHLAHAFAERNRVAGVAMIAAAALDEDVVPDLLDGRRLVVVEDLDALASERALFHLYNMAREAGAGLLLTAEQAPSRLPVALADLRSRLNAAPAVGIGAPDDDTLAAVLVKLFADRQLKVGEEVVAYLLGRIERSFAAAQAVVASADQASLAQRRPVTVPLLRAVLEETA
ncbi:MAG: HdaA/DnaA family protein [Actinomycetota bacterium]